MDQHAFEIIIALISAIAAIAGWALLRTVDLTSEVAVLKNQRENDTERFNALDKKLEAIHELLLDALNFQRRNDHRGHSTNPDNS